MSSGIKDQFVSLKLYKSGISILSQNDSIFVEFHSLTISKDIPIDEKPSGTLERPGLLGIITLGPGFLILIDEQSNVFNYKDTDIWNVTKSLIIPLKFEFCELTFEKDGDDHEDDNVESDDIDTNNENDDNDDNNDNEIYDKENKSENDSDSNLHDGGSDVVDDTPANEFKKPNKTPTENFAEQINKTGDIIINKLGVYADDLKSSASLLLSKKPVSPTVRHDSYSDDPSPSDTSSTEQFETSDASSYRVLKRSISLRRPSNATILKKNEYEDISKSMLTKFIRQLRLFFNTQDFYYSDQIDLTRDIIYENGEISNKDGSYGDSFWFNKAISEKLSTSTKKIIQGYTNSIKIGLNFANSIVSRQGQLLLLSKRSTKRAGMRYLRRGIDDNGNVANFVVTSQIFIMDNAIEDKTLLAKFDILRGSIPLFFQQNPASLKPIPYLTRSPQDSKKVFKHHFKQLKTKYGSVSCVSLVERSKRENEIGSAYYDLCKENDVEISWFDFHEVCKKMKFDKVKLLLDENLESSCDMTVENQLLNYGWYDSISSNDQLGIFRINCIDCLDRTNLVSKFLGEFILIQNILSKYGLSIENPEIFQNQFNNLWADNGDYISRQYASTNALKGDYTRTSKRNYKGLMTDAWLTMSRYYSGYISDYFKQCFVEYILGDHDSTIFEEFESTLDVLDPNEVRENFHKNNSKLKRVIEKLKIGDEDLILVGSWSGFQTSMKFNDLSLDYDASLILTNKTVFIVETNQDDTDDEIKKVLKFPIDDILELQYGSYFKSTHNPISTNPKRNVGIKFIFNDIPLGEGSEVKFLTLKFPVEMEYTKVKYIINVLSKTFHSSTLQNTDIVTLKEAQKKVNVIDVLEHRFKKIVWG